MERIIIMTSKTSFSASEIEGIRKKASVQQASSGNYPEGWSKSKMNPMKVLESFYSLRIKKG